MVKDSQIGKTNSNSCMLDAFAFVTGVPTQTLIDLMGTDGAKGGVPSQLIVSALLELGIYCTPILRDPSQRNPITLEAGPVEFKGMSQEDRWAKTLLSNEGVLCGVNNRGKTHATAWVGGSVHDPSGTGRPFDPYLIWLVRKP